MPYTTLFRSHANICARQARSSGTAELLRELVQIVDDEVPRLLRFQVRRLVRAVFGDWSLGSIISYSSGRPFNITVRGNPANTGSRAIVNRPDVTGRAYAGERTITRDFNVDAFAANQQFQIGNLGRNALRQRGAFGWDFSAYKNISLREGVLAQFRFEAFQFTNTPRFSTPGHTLGTANFGRITAARTPRNLQLGVKLLF